jgi:hypothetical protein
MYILLGVMLLLLFYAARLAEKNGSRIDVLVTSLAEHLRADNKIATQKDTLGYEWHEDGWPQVYSDDLLPGRMSDFENPAPYYYSDVYSESLLAAEYHGAVTAFEKKAFLKRIQRTGISVPLAIADEAFSDADPAVRIYAASHLDLVYKDYTGGDWKNPPTLREFETTLLNDPDPVVQAARFSNPSNVGWPWTHDGSWKCSGPHDFWQKTFAKMSQLERLAAVRNPQLKDKFLIALMEAEPATLNMNRQEHVELICAAAVNPRIVEGSRRTGRDAWGTWGDWNTPFKEYGQMWRIAVDRWLKTAVPYRVLQFIQTTPDVKLEVYNRLPEEKFASLRQRILKGCDRKDAEVLKLGWGDPDEECRRIARTRTGPYLKWLGVNPKKIQIRQYASEKEEVGVS